MEIKSNLLPALAVSGATKEQFMTSLREGDAEAQSQAFDTLVGELESGYMARIEAIEAQYGAEADEQILVARGIIKPITSEARQYYTAVIDRGGFEGIENAFPRDEFEYVFNQLRETHPLISRIDAKDAKGLATFLFSVNEDRPKAFWGPICEDIKQLILKGFKEVSMRQARLSGFIPVCKGMLKLGPVWLAQYVRDILMEIMSASLEEAIINGDGKDKPIGMMHKLSGAKDGVYPLKTAKALSTLEPKDMAGLRAALAKARMDKGKVCLIVNPVTYWLKVFPALAFRADTGAWVLDRLASGEEIIQSYAVPEDKIIVGDPANYFLGVGGQIEINEYRETLAIEDMDLYIAKFYGYGLPKDPNAYFVADIAGVKGGTISDMEAWMENTTTAGTGA